MTTRRVFHLAYLCWRNNHHQLARYWTRVLAYRLGLFDFDEGEATQFLLRFAHTWMNGDGPPTQLDEVVEE
jgi:hypothetical protein